MPEESKESVARELLNALPLKEFYADALAPGAKITGQFVEDVFKAIQLALAPVQIIGVGQDRFRRFIERSRSRIPNDSQVLPPPQIIGPVLEAIRYEKEGEPIEQLFSELLSRSMDRDRCNEAHPAYLQIIKQISPDEATLMTRLQVEDFRYEIQAAFDEDSFFFSDGVIINHNFPVSELHFASDPMHYIEHLHNLGLVEYYDYQQSKRLAAIKTLPSGMTRDVQIGIVNYKGVRFSRWGRGFVKACLP